MTSVTRRNLYKSQHETFKLCFSNVGLGFRHLFLMQLHFLVRTLHMICQDLPYSALCVCHNELLHAADLHYLTSSHCSKCRRDNCMHDSDNSNKHGERTREIDKKL